MTLSAQPITANDLLIRLGAVGSFNGISAAIDGTTNTQLDITVTATGWLLLANGAFYDTSSLAPLASATITGLTANNTYTLWADQPVANQTTAPAFTVSVTAPSANAVAIAQVVVSGNVLTSVTAYTSGLVGAKIAAVSGIQFIQGKLLYNSPASAITVGILPANAIIDYAISAVDTAFNAGTNNFLELGKSGTLNAYLASATNGMGTATSTLLAGLVVGSIGSSAVPVIATYTQSSTAASAGSTTITIFYHLP